MPPLVTYLVILTLAVLGVREGSRLSALSTTRIVVTAAAAAAASGSLVAVSNGQQGIRGTLTVLDRREHPGSAVARSLLSPYTVAGIPVLLSRNVSLSSAAGIVVLLHGCNHDMSVWRLAPLERRVVATLVAEGLFAVAISAASNANANSFDTPGCWDAKTPIARNADVRNVVRVLVALLEHASRGRRVAPPVYAIGTSSGGYMAHTVACTLTMRAIVAVVSSMTPSASEGMLTDNGNGTYVGSAGGVTRLHAAVPDMWRSSKMPKTLLLVAPRDLSFSSWVLPQLAQLASEKGVVVARRAKDAFDETLVQLALAGDGDSAEVDAWSRIERDALINAVPILPRRLSPLTIASAMPSVTGAASGALYWILRARGVLQSAATADSVHMHADDSSDNEVPSPIVLSVAVDPSDRNNDDSPAAALAKGPALHLAVDARDPEVLNAIDTWMGLLHAVTWPTHLETTGVSELDVAFDVVASRVETALKRDVSRPNAGGPLGTMQIALARASIGMGWDHGRSHGTIAAAAAAVRAGACEVLNDLYARHEMTAQGAQRVARWLTDNDEA